MLYTEAQVRPCRIPTPPPYTEFGIRIRRSLILILYTDTLLYIYTYPFP
jgi:hypothetical protein